MVAGARWIAKLSSPTLLKAVEQYPDYEVKVVGHSLGGGTAALLTYILREQMEFSAATCVTFAPARVTGAGALLRPVSSSTQIAAVDVKAGVYLPGFSFCALIVV
ncbi:hypothetical protein ACS0TY_034993 [Phlomoides rotata]